MYNFFTKLSILCTESWTPAPIRQTRQLHRATCEAGTATNAFCHATFLSPNFRQEESGTGQTLEEVLQMTNRTQARKPEDYNSKCNGRCDLRDL